MALGAGHGWLLGTTPAVAGHGRGGRRTPQRGSGQVDPVAVRSPTRARFDATYGNGPTSPGDFVALVFSTI
jgi:hypothetical protein